MNKFLCGCQPSEKHRYSGNTIKNPIPGGDPVYTDKRLDSEGFEVCPEHGERLYGWKSIDDSIPHYISNGHGIPPTFVSPGEQTVEIHPSQEPDLRPHIYERAFDEKALGILTRARAGSNGHLGGVARERVFE